MAKPLQLTEHEQELIAAALDQAIASAKRGQNTAKQPNFKKVYQDHEQLLISLKTKVLAN